MKKWCLCLSATFVLFLISCMILAEEGPANVIITDRPTQALSPFTLAKGQFQFETGAIFVDRNDRINEWKKWSIATTALRYGIYDHFEIRVESSFEHRWISTKSTGADTSYNGLGPVKAGFKVFIAEEKGIRPQLGISGSITFRHLGDKAFAPTFSYPVGLLLASHTLSEKWSLGYNFGFAYGGESADGFFVYSGLIGYQINQWLWSFAEAYGDFDNGDLPNHRLDGGFTFLISDNFQVDLTAGWGLHSKVKRFMLNAGFAWRFPR
jgi:hypothetical protein